MATQPVATPEAGAQPASGVGETDDAALREQAAYVQNMASRYPAMASPDAEENTIEPVAERGRTSIDGKKATEIRYTRDQEAGKPAAYSLSFYDGRKLVASEKIAEALLPAVVGEKNADAIVADKKAGKLKGDTLEQADGWTMQGIIKSRPLPVRPEQPDVDVDKALDAARRNRERDRGENGEISAGRERLFQESEREQFRVRKLDDQSRSLDQSNDLAERNGSASNDGRQELVEREKDRRIEMMQVMRSEYRVDGANYYFKDKPGKVAFRDTGDKLKTSHNDQRVARSMATMAYAQGWKTIRVNGHHEFKRDVWFEASLQGLKVEGYSPKPEEVKALEEARERQMRNSVERVPERERNRPETAAEHVSAAAAEVGKDAAQKTAKVAGAVVQKTFTGMLVEHGSAKYNHEENGSPSYFVKLATPAGIRTVWGKDLERAMADNPVKVGDAMQLTHRGDKAVTVEAPMLDKDGKRVGTEAIDAKRNDWEVKLSDKGKVVQAVATALVNERFSKPEDRAAVMKAMTARIAEQDAKGTLPKPKLYDSAAPSAKPATERARPPVERNAERTR